MAGLPPPLRRGVNPDAGSDWRAQANQNLGGNSNRTRSAPARAPPSFAEQQDQGQAPHSEQPSENGNGSDNEDEFYNSNGNDFDFDAFLEQLQNETNVQQVIVKLSEQLPEVEKFLLQCPPATFATVLKFLTLLGRVCEAQVLRPEKRARLLTTVARPELLSRLPTLLVEAAEAPEGLTQAAGDALLLLTALGELLPLTAATLRGTAASCFSICKATKDVPKRLLDAFVSLLLQLDIQRDKSATSDAPKPNRGAIYTEKRRKEIELLKYAEAPNDFRQMTVFPKSEDLLSGEPPFLRPNIVDGAYLDVEHYLDTQFRLVREDFLRPLREGVFDLVHNTDNRRCESLSVRVYRQVRFLRFVRELDRQGKVQSEGVLLSFDPNGTNKRLRKTKWEHTKRFLYGGLVCFSCNNFKTTLFATIAGRDIKYLKECQILVSFCESYPENVYGKDYVMIESEVFFEPYQQVLRSLQRLNENTFPMAEYIVDVQKEDFPPEYLTPDEEGVDEYGYYEPVIIKFRGARDRELRLEVLDPDSWPSAEQMGLDRSQRRALQAALSKELVVIQGPPGTGKTFLALKLAEILVNNKTEMKRMSPVLVVCLTNHALDQFLVGMLKFTTNLVRIGGQSRCPELEEYNLKKLSYRRTKTQFKLGEVVAMQYRELEALEAKLSRWADALGKKGFLLDDEICGEDFTGSFSHWLLGSRLQSFVERHFPDCFYISFSDLRQKIIERHVKDIQDLHNSRSNKNIIDQTKKKIEEKYETLATEVELREKALQIIAVLDSNGQSYASFNVEDRVRLYYIWLREMSEDLELQKKTLQDSIAANKEKIENIRLKDTVSALKDKDVIGLTTNGAARHHKLLGSLGCEIVIVEEAAEVMESHIVACVSHTCEHLILIGDHKQLRPSIAVYELGKFYDFDVSLFERMVRNREGCVTLQVQHRMAPEMAELIVPTIYETLENHRSVLNRANIRGVQKRLFFVSHNHDEQQDQENSSRTNTHEADFLIALCKRLLKQDYDAEKITILSAYKGQMFLIKKKIADEPNKSLQKVLVTVVDNYQGEENDIILLSLVRSNPQGKIGFLATENRVCVALSRARNGLFIMGNMNQLAAYSETWQAIRNSLQKQEALDVSLPLRCEVHKEEIVKVTRTSDFIKLAPYDGCGRICGERLNCNHECKLVCHLMHFDHEDQRGRCESPCSKMCSAGLHDCKLKCYMPCKKCNYKVDKLLPCGHEARTECWRDPATVACKTIVERDFGECGHQASVACWNWNCPKPCDRQAPCGHSCTLQCHMQSDPDHLRYECPKPCSNPKKGCSTGTHDCPRLCYQDCELCVEQVSKRRSCGHTFKKMKCHEDVETVVCQKKCRRALDCNHYCPKKCHENCYPCQQMVTKERSCGHQLRVQCSQDPEEIDCKEPCTRQLECGHGCLRKCNEDCNLCIQNVDKTLNCGHIQVAECFVNPVRLSCREDCERVCDQGHPCPLACKQPCGPCKWPVDKVVPKCGHTVEVPCSITPGRLNCGGNCVEMLSCGHRCQLLCRDDCRKQICLQPSGSKVGPCGHQINVNCRERQTNAAVDSKRCTAKCNATLDCGHICEGQCVGCYQGRFHVQCNEVCGRILFCGHRCAGLCGAPCPPCEQTVQVTCDHSVKTFVCGRNDFPDAPCKEIFFNPCSHKKTGRLLCDEASQRKKQCVQPCPKKLECGHQCVGLCGEACISICWVCNKADLVAHAFIEQPLVNNPRFVKLNPCGHVVELRSMMSWMLKLAANVVRRSCPVCLTPLAQRGFFRDDVLELFKDWQTLRTHLEGFSHITASRLIDEMNILCQDQLLEHAVPTYWFDNELRELVVTSKGEGRNLQHTRVLRLADYKVRVSVVQSVNRIVKRVANRDIFSEEIKAQLNLVAEVLEKEDGLLWLQQVSDLTRLLKQLDEDVERALGPPAPPGALASLMKRLNPFSRPKEEENRVHVPVPLNRLQRHWRKCLHCNHLQFLGGAADGSAHKCDGCRRILEVLPFPEEFSETSV